MTWSRWQSPSLNYCCKTRQTLPGWDIQLFWDTRLLSPPLPGKAMKLFFILHLKFCLWGLIWCKETKLSTSLSVHASCPCSPPAALSLCLPPSTLPSTSNSLGEKRKKKYCKGRSSANENRNIMSCKTASVASLGWDRKVCKCKEKELSPWSSFKRRDLLFTDASGFLAPYQVQPKVAL